MTTLILLAKHPIISLIGVLVLIGIALLAFAWILAEFKSKRFNEQCIFLEALLNEPASQRNFNIILHDYSDLECWSDEDHKRVSAINRKIKLKYKGYLVTEDDEFSPGHLDHERVSRELKIANQNRLV
jgi:hypothetical protein